jgi:PadR family transcriptional regulator PadR
MAYSHNQLMGELGMASSREKSGDLVQGTLDMLVLRALADGSKHGYAVAEWIHQTSQDVLRVEEGALYPALHRLELKGLLKSEWGTSDNNRRAKFYALTATGRKHLAAEQAHWGRMTAAISRVLQSA